jgi:uncharacterized protein YfaA (DUF2138 family)
MREFVHAQAMVRNLRSGGTLIRPSAFLSSLSISFLRKRIKRTPLMRKVVYPR